MAGIDKAKLERYRKGELKFLQVFDVTGAQLASILKFGHNAFVEGRLEDARKVFEGLAVMEPNHPYVQCMLGAVYQRLEQYDKALARYELALKLNSRDLWALTNRGEIFLMLGKFTEAAAELKKVLELDPQKKSAISQRAQLLSVMAAESLRKVRGTVAVAR